MSNVKSRLYSYIEHKGVTVRDFERGANLSNGYVSSIRKSIGDKSLIKILGQYTDLNRDWLLYGDGDMLISEKSNADVYTPEHIMEVQIIPYTARAGSLGDYEQILASDEYDTMLIPTEKVRKGKYLVFTVGGDSMENTLLHGDKVLARLVQRHLWEGSKLHLRQWSIWIIVTRTEGILIKDIIDHDVENHKILLHSFNTIYEDFWVDLEDVVDIYNVVELVGRKL